MDNQGLQVDEQQPQQPTDNDVRQQSHEKQDLAIDLWPTVDKSGLQQDIHIIPLVEVYKRFHTNPRDGLSATAVVDALAQYGENKITAPKSPNCFWLLFKEMFIGFNILLWIAGIFAFLAYKPFGDPDPSIANLALGVVLFSIITCNSILNVYQEMKSMKMVTSFSNLSPQVATVRRDGRDQQIVVNQIVPGDIILIRMGDKLHADCRFLICDELKVNISIIIRIVYFKKYSIAFFQKHRLPHQN
jgi:sodium/potassium-transporting ATPase subunit alpha